VIIAKVFLLTKKIMSVGSGKSRVYLGFPYGNLGKQAIYNYKTLILGR